MQRQPLRQPVSVGSVLVSWRTGHTAVVPTSEGLAVTALSLPADKISGSLRVESHSAAEQACILTPESVNGNTCRPLGVPLASLVNRGGHTQSTRRHPQAPHLGAPGLILPGRWGLAGAPVPSLCTCCS